MTTKYLTEKMKAKVKEISQNIGQKKDEDTDY